MPFLLIYLLSETVFCEIYVFRAVQRDSESVFEACERNGIVPKGRASKAVFRVFQTANVVVITVKNVKIKRI